MMGRLTVGPWGRSDAPSGRPPRSHGAAPDHGRPDRWQWQREWQWPWERPRPRQGRADVPERPTPAPEPRGRAGGPGQHPAGQRRPARRRRRCSPSRTSTATSHQIIYRAIRDLYDLGKAIDAITLADELIRRDQFQAIGGDETLSQILNSVPHAANAKYYAGIVREKSISRAVDRQRQRDPPRRLLEQLHRRAAARGRRAEDLRHRRGPDQGGHGRAQATSSTQAMDRIAARTEAKHPITGVATGFFDLDDITGGFQPEQLIILAARPSMGKTAFALNICDHVAVEPQDPRAVRQPGDGPGSSSPSGSSAPGRGSTATSSGPGRTWGPARWLCWARGSTSSGRRRCSSTTPRRGTCSRSPPTPGGSSSARTSA